jgi:hypothetical protein
LRTISGSKQQHMKQLQNSTSTPYTLFVMEAPRRSPGTQAPTLVILPLSKNTILFKQKYGVNEENNIPKEGTFFKRVEDDKIRDRCNFKKVCV